MMRNPWEPPPSLDREISTAGERARIASVTEWLRNHPEVTWSAEQMAERITEVGQRRAALEARAAAHRDEG
jgi:hypothetical protein